MCNILWDPICPMLEALQDPQTLPKLQLHSHAEGPLSQQYEGLDFLAYWQSHPGSYRRTWRDQRSSQAMDWKVTSSPPFLQSLTSFFLESQYFQIIQLLSCAICMCALVHRSMKAALFWYTGRIFNQVVATEFLSLKHLYSTSRSLLSKLLATVFRWATEARCSKGLSSMLLLLNVVRTYLSGSSSWPFKQQHAWKFNELNELTAGLRGNWSWRAGMMRNAWHQAVDLALLVSETLLR